MTVVKYDRLHDGVPLSVNLSANPATAARPFDVVSVSSSGLTLGGHLHVHGGDANSHDSLREARQLLP